MNKEIKKLHRTIEEWSRKHDLDVLYEEQSPLGERFEIRWLDRDPAIVRFIDVYPRDNASRVILQKGIYANTSAPAGGSAPEDTRQKGPLYSRPADEVLDILEDLKPAERTPAALAEVTV